MIDDVADEPDDTVADVEPTRAVVTGDDGWPAIQAQGDGLTDAEVQRLRHQQQR